MRAMAPEGECWRSMGDPGRLYSFCANARVADPRMSQALEADQILKREPDRFDSTGWSHERHLTYC
jgi:hypothetical protein